MDGGNGTAVNAKRDAAMQLAVYIHLFLISRQISSISGSVRESALPSRLFMKMA